MDKAKKIEKKKKIKFNVKKPTMATAPPKAPPKKKIKFNVVKAPSNQLEGKLYAVYSKKVYGGRFAPVFKKITKVKDGKVSLVKSNAIGEVLGKTTTTITLEKMKNAIEGKEKRQADIKEPIDKSLKSNTREMLLGGKIISSKFF